MHVAAIEKKRIGGTQILFVERVARKQRAVPAPPYLPSVHSLPGCLGTELLSFPSIVCDPDAWKASHALAWESSAKSAAMYSAGKLRHLSIACPEFVAVPLGLCGHDRGSCHVPWRTSAQGGGRRARDNEV